MAQNQLVVEPYAGHKKYMGHQSFECVPRKLGQPFAKASGGLSSCAHII